MNLSTLAPLARAFQSLPDPRRPGRTLAHNLYEILTLALCAAIGAANDWVAVEIYCTSKIDWLRRFLPLENGIPSHDTFGRVFARIDPVAFQACFGQWIAGICAKLGLPQVAIDGKRLAGSEDKGAGIEALHLVSAWATEARLSLGQVAVDDKSNEITAIPQLLELLAISGALVSIDAMGCQKEIAAKVRDGRADYLLAVKENQPRLYEDIDAAFRRALDEAFASGAWDSHTTWETNRGRDEMRACYVLDDVTGVRDRSLWKDLKSLVVVVTERGVGASSASEVRFSSVAVAGRRSNFCIGRVRIGALRMVCIGRWMWYSRRINIGCATATTRRWKISVGCVGWYCRCSSRSRRRTEV